MTTAKLVVVGDRGVGKTCLLIVYARNTYPTEYVPATFDQCVSDHEIDDQSCRISLWDTSESASRFTGEERVGYMLMSPDPLLKVKANDDYDQIRPLSYPVTDVFLLCFSLVDSDSYDNVERKWYPELTKHCPDVPIILVGTKLDLREDKELSVKTACNQSVSMQEGINMQAKNPNVVKYLECSALTNNGVKEVFDEAARAALKFKASTQSSTNCLIL